MRLEQLQEFIWKHFIRKPCRVQLSTVSCSLTVGNEIFQQRDTYQLPTAHLAELLRSCDEIPWTGQCSKSFLYLLDFLSLRHVYKWNSHLKFPFSLYSKSNSFLCTCRLYVHKKTPLTHKQKYIRGVQKRSISKLIEAVRAGKIRDTMKHFLTQVLAQPGTH